MEEGTALIEAGTPEEAAVIALAMARQDAVEFQAVISV